MRAHQLREVSGSTFPSVAIKAPIIQPTDPAVSVNIACCLAPVLLLFTAAKY